jgi:hypothetical protein
MRPFLRILILLWILGILFPMAFLGKLWPDFGRVFRFVFAAGWMNILMHGMLYAVLGVLLAKWIPLLSARSVSLLLGFSLLVGILHEGVQILAAGSWPGWSAELLDLSVDQAGACLGLAFAR